MIYVLRNVTWIVGGLLLAALVHLSVILLVPSLASTDAWTRLGLFEVGTGFQILPAPSPEQSPIRLADPATAIAICRYDLDDTGPIKITGRLQVAYWGLSIHNRQGFVFYAINDRSIGDRPLELRVMSPEDISRFRADLPDAAEQELLIPSAQAQGFVLVRVILPVASARQRVEAELAKLRCGPAT